MSDLNDPVLRRAVERHERRRRAKERRLPYVIAVLVVLLGVGGVWYANYDTARTDRQFTERAEFGGENRERIETLEQYVEAQRSQFEACKNKTAKDNPDCDQPVAPPVSEIDDDEPVPPTIIRESLSSREIEQAVASYCTGGECAREPSEGDINAAVAAYCTVRDGCQPEPIQPQPGPSGAPGQQGEAGRAPTTEEIASAVAAYCAEDRCRGPKGERGERGRAAEEIIEMACFSQAPLPFDLTLRLTFDSGRTLERACATSPAPEPTEPAPEE